MLHSLKPCQIMTNLASRWGFYFGLALVTTVPFFTPNLANAQTTISVSSEQTPTTATTLFVNPENGNDQLAEGTAQSPFKTITQALQIAPPHTVIHLAPGVYSQDTGEVFPLVIPPHVTLQGNENGLGKDRVITGNGAFSSATEGKQNVAIVVSDSARLIGVTITNRHHQGYGVWSEAGNAVIRNNSFIQNGNAGIGIRGDSRPEISNNAFVNNDKGMIISGTSVAQVRNNRFENTGYGVTIQDTATPQLWNNHFSQNSIGVLVEGKAQPTLRQNIIEKSTLSGLSAIAQANPDLGTIASPGENTFRSNAVDINNATSNQTLVALNNQLSGTIEGKVSLAPEALHIDSVTITPSPTPSPSTPKAVTIAVSAPPSSPLPSSRQISQVAPISIAINPPSEEWEDNNGLERPRKTLAEILVLEPNLNPDKYTPRYTILSPSAVATTPPPPTSPTPTPPPQNSYRVMVQAEDSKQEEKVRSLIPGAFRTSYNGQTVLQVGLFSSRENAEQILNTLNGSGLKGVIVPL